MNVNEFYDLLSPHDNDLKLVFTLEPDDEHKPDYNFCDIPQQFHCCIVSYGNTENFLASSTRTYEGETDQPANHMHTYLFVTFTEELDEYPPLTCIQLQYNLLHHEHTLPVVMSNHTRNDLMVNDITCEVLTPIRAERKTLTKNDFHPCYQNYVNDTDEYLVIYGKRFTEGLYYDWD